MASTTNNTIIVNAVTTAVDTMVNSSIAFAAACDTVRAYRVSGKLDDKTARGYFQSALVSKVVAYKTQVTATGKPAPGSAYQRAVSRLMNDTAPTKVSHEVQGLEVPAAIQALMNKAWAVCAEYEGAAKLAATALANAKAGK